MDTNDFDIDFDFDKEYGQADDVDLTAYDTDEQTDDFQNYDLEEDDDFERLMDTPVEEELPEDSEDAFMDEDIFFPRKREPRQEQSQDAPEDPYDPDGQYPAEDPYYGEQEYDPDDYDPNGYDPNGEYNPNGYDPNGDYDPNGYDPNGNYDPNGEYDPNGYDPNGEYDPNGYDPNGVEEPGEARKPKKKKKLTLPTFTKHPKKEKGEKSQSRPKREKRERKPRKPPQMPAFLKKFLAWYMEPINRRKNPEPETVGEDGRRRRRRKPTKAQIFKEAYLPPLIAGVALVLILSFVTGSISNAFAKKKLEDAKKQAEALQASQEADRIATVYQQLLRDAEEMAVQYNYDDAVKALDEFVTDDAAVQQEITAKKAEYLNAKATLQEWKDINAIPNLSFHVLIQDPVRAFASKELGGQYNRNFVTVGEFTKILEQLYNNGYVLVDFKHIVASNADLTGSMNFSYNPIYLPDGKKPVMLTETMVNYFDYMVDGNKDGEPDAAGDGFANRLVVENGEIKARYVDANGQSLVGDYDFVPVLETFIKQHPDFSYKGSRATLAVTGNQGVFGYRTNTSYIQKFGQEYYDKEVADAKVLVQALRDKGYTIASYTYSNKDYRQSSVAEIRTDLQNWTAQITPVLGDVDTIVYAKSTDIEDYSGAKFNTLFEAGFRFFVTNSSEPKMEINISNVRQSRLMVTGNSIAWHAAQFNGYFDPNVVLDITNRKSVPN